MQNWAAWRLVMNGFSYREVFYDMAEDEILEANCALDIQAEADAKAARKNMQSR